MNMSPVLRDLVDAEAIGELDAAFATAVARVCGETDPLAIAGAAAASAATRSKDACAHLPELARGLSGAQGAEGNAAWPGLDEWLGALRRSPLVATRGEWRPLVLDGDGRLYLYRYWDYERRLAALLTARAEGPLREVVFGGDPQERAVSLAASRRLAIISGGPGSGKTYTVTRIIAALFVEALEAGTPIPRVALMAPTGKAAARLEESIGEALRPAGGGGPFGPGEVRALVEVGASTIHRAFGWSADRGGARGYHPGSPLPADVVVVDEASMVDLSLMTRLVESVPGHARLIFLGDRNQLSSVEAGSVFGDMCAAAAEAATGSSPLGDCLVELTGSHRFSGEGGIGRLADAILAGETGRVVQVLREGGAGDLRLDTRNESAEVMEAVVARGLEMFERYALEESPEGRLEMLGRARILCAHRRGPLGAEAINAAIEGELHSRGLIGADRQWYDGRPVMVTRNDPGLDLFNGDVGVVVARGGGRPSVVFEGRGGELREVAAARLPECETVFATTVHRAQGSQFEEVALVLPPTVSTVATRELVYTAVTRGRRRVTVHAVRGALEAAIARRTRRASGLHDRLRGRG